MTKEEKIKKYYKNCYPSNIEYSNKVREENGNKNNLYFRELTLERYNLWNKEVDKNIAFSEETKEYLKIENRQLHYLFNDIFKLFHHVCVFEETPTGGVKSINLIFRAEYDIEKCFSNIDFHSLFINTLIENKQYNEAIAVKNYLLTRIDTVITNSKQLFGISLLKSPLAEYFTNYISSLKEAINTDEIKLSIELEKPKEKQPIKEEPKQDKSIILTEIHDHHSGKKTCYEYEHVLKRFNEIPKHSKFILFNANNRKYAVYSATVSYVFSSKTKGKYNDTDEVFNIDGYPYFKTFTDAYEKGEEDFKADYVNSNLYNSNTEKLVSDIHHAVYHSRFGGYCGWNYVVNLVVDKISHKIIKEYGYYSGMLSGAKEFIKKHPTIFKDVDKCNHSVTKKEFQQENNKAEIILQEIWLPTAKITVKQFLEKGEKLGIWNSDLNLTQQRGAKLYGSGKTLLASLAGALKNYAIMESLDYKIIGKAFCKAFNIEEKKGVEEHYKAFNSYNDKYRKEFIRAFNIKL
ncbi:hypothetical protein [Tenacibaculum finnmarkense]|uniref:hypothetical protein n=1 Tax=Tenacibaculum finnmarkense TaxID=2781243 RepID=UPI001E3767C9|nr:hypothetical protein [Tenacibaculum finnmarkense]MCD8438724.1 hypothetical protein [Tenacibaculum finnmarkense genomovar ulcerans]MCG8720952.1 hypothetical protein [Tenacibaculum finnmarkense]